MDNRAFILENFRVVNGKLEKLAYGEWSDTSDYVDKKRVRVGNVMMKREKVMQILNENAYPTEDEVENFNKKQAKALQRLQDTQRIERALVRKELRSENKAEAVFEELLEMIPRAKVGKSKAVSLSDGGTLIIQISDAHFNEMVSLPNNIFNAKVQSQRIYKYIKQSIAIGIGFNVRRAIFVLTGDLVNSSRREGEALSNEYNSAHATLMAFEVISGAIEMVSSYFKITSLLSVLGNESRNNNELCLEAKVFLNNFDYIIHNMLTARYSALIECIPIGNPVERIMDIDGVKILATHGLVKPKDSVVRQLTYYRTKYGRVDHILCGHLHESLCAPNFSRSGSTVGGNTYSELTLGIATSVPSQSCHVVQDGCVFSFPIDLTSVSEEYFSYTEPPSQRTVIKTEVTI